MSKEKLLKLKEKIIKLNNEISGIYQEGLKEYAMGILEKYPNVKGISWTQYTPYFNDGEPCEFGINADYPSVLLEGQDDWYDIQDELIQSDWNSKTYKSSNYRIREECAHLTTVEDMEALTKDIRQFASDALYPFEKQLQGLVGEGRVLLTAEGIEVEDYDHD